MRATIEISLYPLRSDYEQQVLSFLDQINQSPEFEVNTSGMSTLIYGEYDALFDLMRDQLKRVFDQIDAIAVLKIGKGELRYP